MHALLLDRMFHVEIRVFVRGSAQTPGRLAWPAGLLKCDGRTTLDSRIPPASRARRERALPAPRPAAPARLRGAYDREARSERLAAHGCGDRNRESANAHR